MITCPYCKNGKLNLETIERYPARLGGIPFIVNNAKIAKCGNCSNIVVSANEIKRWREIQNNKNI
jgi:YgiT-type zinc finger domain-containing protein